MNKPKKLLSVKIGVSISNSNNDTVNKYCRDNETDRSKVIRSLINKHTVKGKLVI